MEGGSVENGGVFGSISWRRQWGGLTDWMDLGGWVGWGGEDEAERSNGSGTGTSSSERAPLSPDTGNADASPHAPTRAASTMALFALNPNSASAFWDGGIFSSVISA